VATLINGRGLQATSHSGGEFRFQHG